MDSNYQPLRISCFDEPCPDQPQLQPAISEPSVPATPNAPCRHRFFPAASSETIAPRDRRGSLPTGGSLRSGVTHRPLNSKVNTQEVACARNNSARKLHPLCGPTLSRHGTLLTANATPARASAELKSILGNHNARLKSKAALVRVDSGSAAFHQHVTLEQAKPRARVEVDILPQTNVCIQGSYLRGHIKIYIREATRKEEPVLIAGGKVRVVGFETLGDKSKSSFYQCSAMLSSVTPSLDGLCAIDYDEEGFSRAIEGEHVLPFALYLSLSAENGQARGSLKGQSDISLNYIAMISLKIKDESGRRSIAHFYRSCEVWPRLDPTTILSPALRPLQATTSAVPSKDPDSGRIKLTASIHRLHWVAGQLCQVRIMVTNHTNKTLKELTLGLHRTTTSFLHGGELDLDADPRRPSVSTKQVAESTLEIGHSGVRGYASAKGWWLGVCPGQVSEFEHSILIPVDALTVPRGQLFEVEYSLCVAINSGTRLASNVQVMLPIRIVSFLSIDPPPAQPTGSQIQTPQSPRAPFSRRDPNVMVASMIPGNLPLPDLNSSLDKSGRTIDGDSTGIGESSTAVDNSFGNHPRDQCGHALQFSDYGEVKLGNLSLVDDTDEVVQHAITSAPTDLVYAGFSDLYYASQEQDSFTESIGDPEHDSDKQYSMNNWDHDSVTDVLEGLLEEVGVKNDSNLDSYGVQSILARPDLGLRKQSHFATRVEEKTRLATNAYLNGDRDDRARHEQHQGVAAPAKERHRSGEPNPSLNIFPGLDGKGNQSLWGLPAMKQPQHHASERSSPGPEDNPNSQDSLTRRRECSWPGSTSDRDSRGTNAMLLAPACSSDGPYAPPESTYQQEHKAATVKVTPGPLCGHCAARIVGGDGVGITTSPLNTTAQQQNSVHIPTHTLSLNTDTSLPHVAMAALRISVDLERTLTADSFTLTPVSATSTTSCGSAVSVGNMSVKDKVRQLEERVKATTATQGQF